MSSDSETLYLKEQHRIILRLLLQYPSSKLILRHVVNEGTQMWKQMKIQLNNRSFYRFRCYTCKYT